VLQRCTVFPFRLSSRELIEGKAIQLHPLVCTAFNADFDGDQMAVHVPLSHAAILEAQVLMLSSHNMLNPQDGSPITLPSQDMVLGLYYLTKERKSIPENPVKGEGRRFYAYEEVAIAYNEGQVDLHAAIECRVQQEENGTINNVRIKTTVGRVLFNMAVPAGVPYINELLTKRNLKGIISEILTRTSFKLTAEFLDAIKELGFGWAFKAGLSFNLGDLVIPDLKKIALEAAQVEVDEVWENYNMGLITYNERYNQIIDKWTFADHRITDQLMKELSSDKQGFNSVFMMLDSGARGSKQQIKQLCGLRGLMAKPRKSGDTGGAIIENPILSNFLEGLSVQEFFISTHGARKGLADTALKTADAGYLTRRLVDVAQDVVIREVDCNTLRGIDTTAFKEGEKIIVSLKDRIKGRYSLHDVYNPDNDKLIVAAGEYITDLISVEVEAADIEMVSIRSVLTCESRHGVCAKCYGKNLATGRIAEMGDATGIIAAQSIGEPGTQLTLRTFHTGGTAMLSQTENSLTARNGGKLEFDSIRTVDGVNSDGQPVKVVVSRTGEIRMIDPKSNRVLYNNYIPYGAFLFVVDGQEIQRGDKICEWDPFNAVIVSDFGGLIRYNSLEEGTNYRVERDDQTGFAEKIVIESKNKKKIPSITVMNPKTGEELKTYSLPVGAYISVEDDQEVVSGQQIVKIPRKLGKISDITGGLPRVTELFEARNPSNPAVVAEIDGVITFGAIKRGNREAFIKAKDGQECKYLIPLTKHVLVQSEDFVRSGTALTEGTISVKDILSIRGPFAASYYLVNGVQEVYRSQGININDKHIEVIVRQMLRRLEIVDAGDTHFLDGEPVERNEFVDYNDWIYDKKFVLEAGESTKLKPGALVTLRQIREENSFLKRNDKKLVEYRDAVPATAIPMLLGITKASLGTESWISAASFQETTKVLSTAAIAAKKDFLMGLKENVIVGKKIPAGTGMRLYENLQVTGSGRPFKEANEPVAEDAV
jgi:DNA-directed RNA polymerase subunit beta'